MTYGHFFNIAHLEPCSHIFGPGQRFVIWVQGCSLACKGCWNQQMWSPRPNQLIHREKLLEQILSAPHITGITLLGGEPLQQFDNSSWLLQQVKQQGLDTMVYTGYTVEELQASPEKQAIFQYSDILITGRYQAEKRDLNLQWRGSSNQRILFPTSIYDATMIKDANQVELVIDEQGAITFLGYPEESLLLGYV